MESCVKLLISSDTLMHLSLILNCSINVFNESCCSMGYLKRPFLLKIV